MSTCTPKYIAEMNLQSLGSEAENVRKYIEAEHFKIMEEFDKSPLFVKYAKLYIPKGKNITNETNKFLAKINNRYPKRATDGKVVSLDGNHPKNSNLKVVKINATRAGLAYLESKQKGNNNTQSFAQESGTSLSKKKIENLQNTLESKLLEDAKNEKLSWKTNKPYVVLNEEESLQFDNYVNVTNKYNKKNGKKLIKYPKKFGSTKMDKARRVLLKSNNNPRSSLYDLVDFDTGEVIREKVRLYTQNQFRKKSDTITSSFTPNTTKMFSANRSIAFSLYKQLPSKNKYIAQAKTYLYDGIKKVNEKENSDVIGEKVHINLDEIENLLSMFPDELFNYINTSLIDLQNRSNVNAEISINKGVYFHLPKLGFIKELERIIDIPLLNASFKNYDRSGEIQKIFRYSPTHNGGWGETLVIDNTMTLKQLNIVIPYYLKTKNYFTPSDTETNVLKYAEHRKIDLETLKKLLIDDDLAYSVYDFGNNGESPKNELLKWRQKVKNYNWKYVEVANKPYDEFMKKVSSRLSEKFKDKILDNNISYLDYFFSGDFNFLNINFNLASSTVKSYDDVGAITTEDSYNRLAAILHEPFHALHALSYGSKEERAMKSSFDALVQTKFGKELMTLLFKNGYNNKEVDYNTMYKEFTAFSFQLIHMPSDWLNKTDLRSNDIFDFVSKIQSLQDKTYIEIVKTKNKIGTIEEEIDVEEKVKLNFLENLYNLVVSAINKLIPISKQFIKVIEKNNIVSKKVITDVFGEVEEKVEKTLKLPEDIKKSKKEFLEALDELKVSINELMETDTSLFSSKNISNFFNDNSNNAQESGKNINDTQLGIDNKMTQLSENTSNFEPSQEISIPENYGSKIKTCKL